MRLTWVQPEDLVPHAFVQARHESADAAALAALEREWVQAGGALAPPVSGAGAVPASAAVRAVATRLLDAVDDLTLPVLREGRGYAAPSPLAAPPPPVSEGAVLQDRVLGAWLGRCAGCLLGKPVEKIPREGIEDILRSQGRWPLSSYFTAEGLPPEVAERWPWNRRSAPTSLVENIDGMPEDDDLNFAVLALRLLQAHGRAPSTEEVAQAWLDNLPAGRVFTAERVAYRNLLLGQDPASAALAHNPFREWIGALIRADVYGWVHPGDVVTAAGVVAQDARLSHTGAGVDGAMWAAALASAALVSATVGDAVDAARAVLPPDSSLGRAVDRGVELARQDITDEEALEALHAELGHLHWVHVLNNAAVIAFALVRGGGDLGRSICLAVTAGWDTDSAGATVGGVVGAVAGARSLPPEWVAPLDNRLRTSLPGPPVLEIDALARDTVELATHLGKVDRHG